MVRAALIVLAMCLASVAAAQDSLMPPRPKRQPYVITRAEFLDVTPRGDPEDGSNVWPLLRPEWERFERSIPRVNQSPSGFRPGVSGSACIGFKDYVDDREVRVRVRLKVSDLAEIRLIPPHSARQIGDSLVRTGDCGALHLISMTAWEQLRDTAQALDAMASLGDVTIGELDEVFRTFGLAWRAEGKKEIVYHHSQRADCGEFRRQLNPSWDVLPRAMREQAVRLLTCLQSR